MKCVLWTDSEDDIVRKYYHILPVIEIKQKLNRTDGSIRMRAQKLGISSVEKNLKFRRELNNIHFDETFFEKPDLTNSYWAGFIAADGSISDFSNGQKKLSVQISHKDFNHLERFAKDIKFTGKISEYTRKNNISMCSFSISSDKICNDLFVNFNITPRKTLSLIPPNIVDKKLIHAYIVGLIDGDGWITLRKKYKTPGFGMVGQENVLLWLKNELSLIVESKHKDSVLNRKLTIDRNYSVFSLMNKTYCKDILKLLKEIDVPKLDRKWSKV